MKSWMKMIAPLLIMALLFTACSSGGNGGGNNQQNDPPAASNAGGNSQNEQKEEKKEKIKLRWFVNGWNNTSLPSEDKDFVLKAIEEKFNVDLDLQYMTWGQEYQSKLNTMIASGDIPDVFYMGGMESNTYIKDGVARDIKDWVTPERMPNYFKHWVTEADLAAYQVQDAFKRAPVPYAKKKYRSYYVRKDWLDKLELDMPQTYEDMVNVMKAFTEQDPDGNGKNDTYGYTTYGNGSQVNMEFPAYLHNGLIGPFMIDNGQFVDTRTDKRIQQVLDDVRALLPYTDPDWLLNKGAQAVEKATQGKVGIVFSIGTKTAMDSDPNGIQTKTKSVTGVDSVDWQPFHPWKDTGVWAEESPGNPFLISSKTTDDKVERSLEIMDWLAGEEGFLLTRYGQEGVHYKRDGNKLEIIKDAYQKDIVDNGNFIDIYGWFTPRTPEVFGLEEVDPEMTERDKVIADKVKSYKFLPHIGTSLVVKEGMDLGSLRKKMNEYQVQVLYEDKDASSWPKYREELMTTYGGKDIFTYYAEQVTNATGNAVTFEAE
ncbi:extracellular solute-binding protein [Paenibacillus sp. J5C_2022]|uniref:extracellular solute-binding protein n=1 Tax=Paenibacillus sp. J5C2022 TaxID=2977129 RepID=UPI0021D291B4|nr:extracellular solute-binding protein [Paenibacillus sp. J5C2022]MCU6712491.1 extracellular solute-binding protein [Paenibacillus sp. J5C2022]